MSDKGKPKLSPEVEAIGIVYAALGDLGKEAQARVLNYVAEMLKISSYRRAGESLDRLDKNEEDGHVEPPEITKPTQADEVAGDKIEGISPVGKRWMIRNGIPENQLSAIFSLGVDEIDLIAKTVPGRSLKEKARSVALLKGIAAYLGTGATRFTHEQLKEACLHYRGYDATNFSKYMKSISSEVSGNAGSGYTLTTRGLAGATELVKRMIDSGKGS